MTYLYVFEVAVSNGAVRIFEKDCLTIVYNKIHKKSRFFRTKIF